LVGMVPVPYETISNIDSLNFAVKSLSASRLFLNPDPDEGFFMTKNNLKLKDLKNCHIFLIKAQHRTFRLPVQYSTDVLLVC
jgi:hypothetical protein